MALKDIDSAARASVLKSMVWTFPFLAVLGYYLSCFVDIPVAYLILLAFLVSFVVAICVQYFAEHMGASSANFVYGSGKNTFTVRERLAANLSQARYHKMRKEYDQALQVLDETLCKDPEFPEALLLKAQIHWEGFQEGEEAKQCLLTLFRSMRDKDAPLNRWGKELYKVISISYKSSASM
jgi:hypothetical protein